MIESIYRNWYFPRPELADRILAMLLEGPGDPVALVGERRIGKTSHLLFELAPAAEARGLLAVYIDIFQHRADPLAAINYALREAIDDLEVPKSALGKRLKTRMKTIGIGPASLELAEQASRTPPEDPFLLIDWLLKTLVRSAKRPLLLVFDEIQELAARADGENIVSAIRSAITKSKINVRVVFTGSSQEKLLLLFARAQAALYEGASTLAFPLLGEEFVSHIAQRSKERFKKRIAAAELAQAFQRLQHQPRALIDLVLLYASSEGGSLLSILDERIEAQLMGAQYDTLWSSLNPLQRRICLRIARGEDVTSANARREYAVGSTKSEIPTGTVSDALRVLVVSHVLTKSLSGRGRYRVDDPLFEEWLRRVSAKPPAGKTRR